MSAPLLRLDRFAAPQGCFHIARTRIGPGIPRHVHRHDFPELFWIEHGAGRHRICGDEYDLSAGDICFVRAEDEHGLGGAPGGMSMLNIAFAPGIAADLARRYGADGDLWAGGPAARRRHLPPAALGRLATHIEPLTAAYGGARERLAVDRFLLELIDVLALGGGTLGPPWLRSALASLAADPRLLAEGPLALRALSGRSREHIARSIRRHLGRSPGELLLSLRLDRAAQCLRLHDDPILDLALDCGFGNLSYFYRRFRARFGCTPRAYRNLHRGLVPAAG